LALLSKMKAMTRLSWATILQPSISITREKEEMLWGNTISALHPPEKKMRGTV